VCEVTSSKFGSFERGNLVVVLTSQNDMQKVENQRENSKSLVRLACEIVAE